MLNKKICIYGAGGFAREVLCCLIDSIGKEIDISEKVCFMVDDEYFTKDTIMDLKVIKRSEFKHSIYDVVVAIGDPKLREIAVKSLPKETSYINVIHPTAIVSKFVDLGKGCIICAGSILTCNIILGNHVHLNLNTTIGHDCIIDDYFTTAPAVNISGNCNIGKNVYIGTNACLREALTITNNVTIGMGSVVVKSIEVEGIYIGNPLRKLDKK